ncbi:MAG: undecaprenyl/decaprenyl-phosphate alpha-N-acetylglucosaminyl 1-phosphate transferase [Cytophagales bacterium]|nr:MAG: undecaprenyl/decaprenyl-phosphate alpha-N-acetylglucosaminyl 1-phosphate transferase [Cytophagales bacterium]
MKYLLGEAIAVFSLSYLISFFAIPALIRIAEEKHLYDQPDNDRKRHIHKTPTLGGVAIFGGAFITAFLFVEISKIPQLSYIFPAILILFFIGIKDDIIPLSASKKIIAQFLAASIVVLRADIRLTGLYGLWGVDEINYYVSVLLSIITILLIINSFNLLDGINGLAGSIGLLVCMSFGILFYMMGDISWLIFALSICGAIVGFLYYNFSNKASIFMGDTGSMTIGLFASVLAFTFINENSRNTPFLLPYSFAPFFAFVIMGVPLIDTLRVFVLRLLSKKSPFSPDRKHFHYYLIDWGFSHVQSTLILVFSNIFLIVLFWFLSTYSMFILLPLLIVLVVLALMLIEWKKYKQK